MSLSNAVQGARHSGQQVTWSKSDGSAYDLTGATITARLRNKETGAVIDSDGAFTLVTPASGIFNWAYGANDVANAGKFEVQFKAAYSDSKYDKTFSADWEVEGAL